MTLQMDDGRKLKFFHRDRDGSIGFESGSDEEEMSVHRERHGMEYPRILVASSDRRFAAMLFFNAVRARYSASLDDGATPWSP